MYSITYRSFLKVFVASLILFSALPAAARAQLSCRIFARSALECLDVEDDGYEKILKRYCQSIYQDTRSIMRRDTLRRDLRRTIRGVSCEMIRASGPHAALDDTVQAFRTSNNLVRKFEEKSIPTRTRRRKGTLLDRLDTVSFPEIADCPSYDDGAMPETRVCRYFVPAAPSADRPDVVLVISGGMVTGMTLLRHPAKVVIEALSERYDVWSYVAEAAPLHTMDIGALRWQIANLARGFVEEHPKAQVVLLGFSNGAAQIYHAINEVFPRNLYAAARPALAIILDIIDATPFVPRTLTVGPGTRFLSFHGEYARSAPIVHGAHRIRCVDDTACAVHAVRHSDGRLGNHADIPWLVANTAAYRKILVDALLDALP